MGLQIGDIVSRRGIKLEDLRGKTIAVDAYNAIYQFLSSIRQYDGTPLMDSKGKVTSHLSGLFYRNVNLLNEGMKLIYVFDGKSPELKSKTKERRQESKDVAQERYERAIIKGDFVEAGRYAKQGVRMEEGMLEESMELLEAMGIAVVQAPGEGEMQCAELVKSGEAWAVGSQDYDALVVGGKRLIQNLTLAKKRKVNSGIIDIGPEMIEYEKVLNGLGIDADQFICLAILSGTDFNQGGVSGIGPKRALALVKDKKYPVAIFKEVEEKLDFNWQEVFEIFKKPNVAKVKIDFPKIDEAKIKEILVERHDFSPERVEKQLEKLRKGRGKAAQKTLF
ncbi:flap endonuclease-1 [Candidatus Pacearchaeota archaeon CG10_big_fil_rev_8_21_14_0_10_35_219]|nr:flap endonuclease-1 [Candidatus Pacearchaeota archaeon]OIO42482.1 MAG: flap endonuclease-1 [Candidatus Pacearchaeota archaeon CG1_02_35_32]PIO08415.1 MAG: flap endonuclease-1 [Candidatus Pacearchaeota archaeon CG10_big_fil_rev_8_21_14_0_10_35_219]PIY81822.1 MAG: flap endonuclease-1 [Candidatus Pacearchaeota archaeon CG_4_10_14_0_8_um_filter_35_169]PIZ80060.1 MAG: flap endonuclease-1 [Candidatus Pacearchaeota archaeon CG_4_10_14_0_2_um_filter_35_33]PJA69981.1 MAG: flap endonuclease-1 [Candid